MKEAAAVKEFKRAIRYAQHQAMTRAYVSGDAWGLMINVDNSYSIRRQLTLTDTVPAFTNRFLLDDNTITINDITAGDGLWFNGLGEPISSAGAAIGPLSYIVADSENLTVCPQTGYVAEGASCP
jgi:type II secretory pathway pseudopilin PulG